MLFKVSVPISRPDAQLRHSGLIISRLFYLILKKQAACDDPREPQGRFVKEGYSAHSNPCFQKGSVFKCSLINE